MIANRLSEVLLLTVIAHRNQLDKAGIPYILHPLRVGVSSEEFAHLLEWSILGEGEFLSRVWKKWPRLSKLPIGTPVRVVVEKRGT